MNKKVLSVTILSFLSLAGASAQQAGKTLFRGQHKMDPVTQSILRHQFPQPAQKGTVASERLIGFGRHYDDGTDTARFVYNSAVRGSNLNNQIPSTYTDYEFAPGDYAQQPYPIAADRNIPAIACDTVMYMETYQNTVEYAETASRTYNAANKVAAQYILTYMDNNGMLDLDQTRTDFTYDAAGNMLLANRHNDTSTALTGQYELVSTTHFNYATGRIAKDSVVNFTGGTPMPNTSTSYTYNAGGNLVQTLRQYYNGSSYEDNQRTFYNYTNNKLSTQLTQYNNSGVWENNSTDTFSYQGNSLARNATYYYDPNNNAWVYGYIITNYNNAQGNPDSQLINAVSNGIVAPLYKTNFNYTAYGHFSSVQNYSFDGTAYNTTPEVDVKFYYEPYNAPAAISTPALTESKITLYPNPAKDVLNIRFNDAPKGAVSVRIFNAMGQLMQVTTLNSSTLQVPVGNLAPGSYFAEVSSSTGSQRVQFVKN